MWKFVFWARKGLPLRDRFDIVINAKKKKEEDLDIKMNRILYISFMLDTPAGD